MNVLLAISSDMPIKFFTTFLHEILRYQHQHICFWNVTSLISLDSSRSSGASSLYTVRSAASKLCRFELEDYVIHISLWPLNALSIKQDGIKEYWINSFHPFCISDFWLWILLWMEAQGSLQRLLHGCYSGFGAGFLQTYFCNIGFAVIQYVVNSQAQLMNFWCWKTHTKSRVQHRKASFINLFQ